ncbi:hypothetical protein BDZ90DRAFT_154410 [Jaminaea rosea]|uniref:Uncharacterized protein n=1 Tax=Jaminaea rosea TaxID=1569628 RepID=A0A316UUI9_9BASI|nr:hypothetical protein BDZ90DRAFT_154410 [Jaminaea rosea]PWN28664.1 hypothetical protein BDZ90DRAFT_154410 [Jaminaea rosea]
MPRTAPFPFTDCRALLMSLLPRPCSTTITPSRSYHAQHRSQQLPLAPSPNFFIPHPTALLGMPTGPRTHEVQDLRPGQARGQPRPAQPLTAAETRGPIAVLSFESK